VLIAALLDPHTKCAVGIPTADCDTVWEYVVSGVVEMA
jgi:hypothetical protein